MATDRARASSGAPAGLDRLLDELTQYLMAQADRMADKAVDKLEGLTDDLLDVADGHGTLAGIGGRMLKGDSPLKAAAGSTLDKVKNAVTGGKGGKGGRKAGAKPTHICESVDIGEPLRTVYDQGTRYEDFTTFAKGVRSVSRRDDTTSDWKLKVGPSTRDWKAGVREQLPDELIVWASEGPKGNTRGCVSFHELAPALTRVLVVVEYYPSGLFEKTGNIWRAQGRRLRLDLKHFARHVTLSDEEPDGWRGEIRDGEVVLSHEDAVEQEESEAGEESEDSEETDAYEDEDEGEFEEENGDDEGAYEDEEEEGEEEADYPDEEDETENVEEDEEDEEEPRTGGRRRRR